MQPPTPKLPLKFIVPGVIIVLVIIVAVIFAISSNKSPASATPTPTPDAVAKGPLAPVFSGFDNLLDHGVTSDQVDALKFAFTKYGKTTGKTFKQVTLDASSLVIADPNTELGYTTATFKVVLDGKTTYYSTLQFSKNLTTSRLLLSATKDGQVVYDSGNIDLFEGADD